MIPRSYQYPHLWNNSRGEKKVNCIAPKGYLKNVLYFIWLTYNGISHHSFSPLV